MFRVGGVRNWCLALCATSTEKQVITYWKKELNQLDSLIGVAARSYFVSFAVFINRFFLPVFSSCKSIQDLTRRKSALEKRVVRIENQILRSFAKKIGALTLCSLVPVGILASRQEQKWGPLFSVEVVRCPEPVLPQCPQVEIVPNVYAQEVSVQSISSLQIAALVALSVIAIGVIASVCAASGSPEAPKTGEGTSQGVAGKKTSGGSPQETDEWIDLGNLGKLRPN